MPRRTLQVPGVQMSGGSQNAPMLIFQEPKTIGRLETPRAPPPPYSLITQSQPRGLSGGSAIITALPIRDDQFVPRTQLQLPRQTTDPGSSITQGTGPNTARDNIYENLSDISQDGDDINSGSRKRPAEMEATAVGVPPNKKKTKIPKFKCKECNQSFNHKWLIEEHIQMHHKFKDIESCIIRTSVSSAKSVSSCSEPDIQSPANPAVDRLDGSRPYEAGFVPPPVTEASTSGTTNVLGQNTESGRENPKETVIDLTTDSEQGTELNDTGSKKLSVSIEDHADPETKKIREILNKMGNDEIREMFQIAKNMRSDVGLTLTDLSTSTSSTAASSAPTGPVSTQTSGSTSTGTTGSLAHTATVVPSSNGSLPVQHPPQFITTIYKGFSCITTNASAIKYHSTAKTRVWTTPT